MSVTRNGRLAVIMFAMVGALLLGLAGPVSAGTGPGSATRLAENDAASRQLGLDDVETDLSVITLMCRGSVESGTPVAECAWRTESTGVASFQLWRLDLRVDDAQRVLVAELGADASTATDPNVTAPGAYLYAVLGLDDDGEIVARSRPDRVRFQDRSIEHLRLECDVSGDVAAQTAADAQPAIGCTWSAAEDSDVRAYRLYRAVHGGERQLIATVGADVTRAVDVEVEAGVRYLYRVEGVDAEGTTVARSRFDAAGWPKPERDGPERDGPERDGPERDGPERRQEVDVDAATLDGADEPAAATEVDGPATEAPPSEASEAPAREVGNRTADGRSDAETSPTLDRGDQQERGR